MIYRKLFFNLIILFILPLLSVWLSLAGLSGIAQAAPASVVVAGGSRLILPGPAPVNIPLQQGTEADLSITKTNGQTETVPGESTTYTITVTNLSPTATITGATVTDTFPGILTNISWTCSSSNGGSCTADGTGDITDINVNLPPSSSVTYVATGTVSASATGSLVNSATVTAPVDVIDPDTTNNSAIDTDTLTPQADLSITKTNNVTQTIPGNSTTYIIVVSNNSGPSVITGATVTDNFPGTLANVDWICTGSGGATCPGSGSNDINVIVNLPEGSSVTFTATGTIDSDATGSLTNTATVSLPGGASDPNIDNNSATDIDILTPQVNLSITKTNGVNSLVPGNNTTYTIVVTNSGPSSANGTTITDNFPSSLTVGTWTCVGSGGGVCNGGTGSGNINRSVDLPPDGSVTFSIPAMVSPSARGTLTNTATVTAPVGATDTTPGNNSVTDTDNLTPQADLRVIKSDSPDPVNAGNTLTYVITVFNDGPSDATGVTLSDNLDNNGVTFQSSTPGSPTCTLVGGDVGCNLGTIPSGGNTPVTIQVLVKSSTPAGFVGNSVLVESPDDSIISNNSANASTTVLVRPDLAISKLESADPTPLGAPLTYTLRITNNGPSDAPGVVVTDTLPGGPTFGSVTTSQGTCTGTSTIVCNLNGMISGATATVTIAINPLSTATLNNTATVGVTGSSAVDPNTSNNSSSTSTSVNLVTDLTITNVDSPDPVTQGNNLTYNLTVTNNGPSNATGVSVTDTLPGGVTFISALPNQGSCSGTTTITCNLGSLVKGGSATIAILVNVNLSTSGNISNTATVSGGGGVDNPANNSATATTFVGIIHKTFLPLVLKDFPVTELSVFNDNTGGNVTFTVLGTGVSCTVPNNTTRFCGSFSPGTYTVQVTSTCGNATTIKIYAAGPQTTRIFCN